MKNYNSSCITATNSELGSSYNSNNSQQQVNKKLIKHQINSDSILKREPERLCIPKRILKRNIVIWTFIIIIVLCLLVFLVIYFLKNNRELKTFYKTSMLNVEIISSNNDFENVFQTRVDRNKNDVLGSHVFPREDEINRSILNTQSLSTEYRMKRIFLTNKSIVCNDGSPAGYYLRKSLFSSSKTWIILLDGGNYCSDISNCQNRLRNSPDLTSSLGWPLFKIGEGILSASKFENRHFWNANVVNVPYCSSDLWLGKKKSNCKSNCSKDFSFMGNDILYQVIDDLLQYNSMNESEKIILSGMSAGGIGVLMSVDELQQKIRKKAKSTILKAIIDSSWILELPYMASCKYVENCPVSRIFQQTFEFWNANIPVKYSDIFENLWDALLPYKLYPFIKTPLFIIQSMFDETQFIDQTNFFISRMENENYEEILSSKSKNSIKKIDEIRKKLIKSLSQVKNYFIPACMTHMILSRPDWNLFKIKNNYLIDAIFCWSSLRDTRNTKINNKGNKQIINQKRFKASKSEEKCMVNVYIDDCKFPNCNSACPSIKHPLTGLSITPNALMNYYNRINNF